MGNEVKVVKVDGGWSHAGWCGDYNMWIVSPATFKTKEAAEKEMQDQMMPGDYVSEDRKTNVKIVEVANT